LFEITDKFGAAALVRLAVLVLAFLTLAALRCPLRGAVWLLTALMRLLDRTVSIRLASESVPPRAAWSKGVPA
jgi:hypothetical protein